VVSDFSGTVTNEKYCDGISYTGQANSTDNVVNIGRFAATLSAGTGYTWSVPTFTNVNLIQRPIYESRVLGYQPTYSASGSMTYTSVTTTTAKYIIFGQNIYLNVRTIGTTGGTAATRLQCTAPFTRIDSSGINVVVQDGSSFIGGNAYWDSSNILVGRYDGANFGLGSSRSILIEHTYKIV
jgi:hypothetical protein